MSILPTKTPKAIANSVGTTQNAVSAAINSGVASARMAVTTAYNATADALSNLLSSGSNNKNSADSEKVPNFVNNLWVGGADDKLATKDVYNGPEKDVISNALPKPTTFDSLKNNFSNGLKTLSAAVKSAASTIRSVRNTVKTVTGAVSAIKGVASAITSGNGNIMERALGANKALGNALNAVGVTLEPSTLETLGEVATMTAKVGTVYRSVSTTNFKNVNAVGNLLKTYTGDNEVFKLADLGADTAKACAVINACVKNGVPNSIPSVLNLLGPNSPINQVVGGTLPTVISAGDIEALNDLNKALNNDELRKICPNVIEDISKYYNKPFFSDSIDRNSRYSSTLSTFSSVNQNWCRSTVGGSDTIDISTLLRSSPDFKELIKYGSMNLMAEDVKRFTDDDRLLGFITMFQPTTVLAELRKQFPMTVINNNVANQNSVTNPLYLAA